MGIRLSRFKLSTSYNTYLVTVQLINGDEFKVFLKDFGFSVRPKDSPKQRRERELRVYRDSLQKPRSARPGTMGPSWMNLKAGSGYCWNLWMAVPVAYCNIEYWRQRQTGSDGCMAILLSKATGCAHMIF